MQASFNLAHFWSQGDAVSHAIAVVLLLMSIASWAVMLGKSWQIFRLRHKTAPAVEAFWQAPDLETGMARLADVPPFADLASHGAQAVRHFESHQSQASHLDARLSQDEIVTRALRQGIGRATGGLENGLTLLASVGSTAPFVGLFGTVWGIYHALMQIGLSGQASLDKVAGPVGEALVMTGAGLFAAIPAVLAYNAFTRGIRVIAADLDAFAYDLHAFYTTGLPVTAPSGAKAAAAGRVNNRLAEVA